MWAEEASTSDQIRDLTLRVHAALKGPQRSPEIIRELMWRTAALKGRLFCSREDQLVPFIDTLQHRLAGACEPSRCPEMNDRTPRDGVETVPGARHRFTHLVEEVSLRLEHEPPCSQRRASAELLCTV